MSTPIPQPAAQSGPWTQLRTGTVSAFTADQVTILVGGASFSAQFTEPYQPRTGDLVVAARQDASWVVLGRLAGQGGNEVAEGSFEDDNPGTEPLGWYLHEISGNTTWGVTVNPDAPDGDQTVAVETADIAAASSYLIGPAVDVVAGDELSLSAYVGAYYAPAVAHSADASLVALWFANGTNVYPTTSAPDVTVDSVTDVTQASPFTGLSGTVIAPVTGVMRPALRSSLIAEQQLQWDFVVVRQRGVGDTGPRGHINYTSITTSTPAVTTTHTIGLTTPVIDFQPQRAYRVTAKGFVQSSVSGDSVRIRVLKTNTAGQGFIDTFSGLVINGNNGMTSFTLQNIFRVTGASVVSAPLVMTYVRQTGTGNVFLGATAANPAYVEITDIGPASEYAGANVLV